MKFTSLALYVVALSGMMISGTSCHGQNQRLPSPETSMKYRIAMPDTSIGTVVQELGNNLMLVY